MMSSFSVKVSLSVLARWKDGDCVSIPSHGVVSAFLQMYC